MAITLINFTCERCNFGFTRSIGQVNQRRLKNSPIRFCSNKCSFISQQKKINLTCVQCKKEYKKVPSQIQEGLNQYCSRYCMAIAFKKDRILCSCKNCNKTFYKWKSWFSRTKYHYCSNGCRIICNNEIFHKRSKFELYTEESLRKLYPALQISFNRRNFLENGLELDICIPSLNLAFEINGMGHYKPIYGNDKIKRKLNFNKLQERDKKKAKLCKKAEIALHVINISKLSNFNINLTKPFIASICRKIDHKLL